MPGGDPEQVSLGPDWLAEYFDRVCPPRKPKSGGEPWEEPATPGTLRAEVNYALEEVRRHLGPVIKDLFIRQYEGDWDNGGLEWYQALNRRRAERLNRRWRLTEHQEWLGYRVYLSAYGGSLSDCRMLFDVIAEDWPLIGAYFGRDPSAPARELLNILDRYKDFDKRLSPEDPKVAMQAFGDILDALRPETREMLREQYLAEFARTREYDRQRAGRVRPGQSEPGAQPLAAAQPRDGIGRDAPGWPMSSRCCAGLGCSTSY